MAHIPNNLAPNHKTCGPPWWQAWLMQMRDPPEPGKLTVADFLALMVILILVWIGFKLPVP